MRIEGQGALAYAPSYISGCTCPNEWSDESGRGANKRYSVFPGLPCSQYLGILL